MKKALKERVRATARYGTFKSSKPSHRGREPPVTSQFLITYNTNHQPTPDARRQLGNFNSHIDNPEGYTFWENVMKVAPRSKGYYTPTHQTLQRTQNIPENADVQRELQKQFDVHVRAISMEVGGKMKRLHGHCFVKITHRSRLHIDAEKFKEQANDYLKERALAANKVPIQIKYVNVRFIPHGAEAVRAYVNKHGFEEVFDDLNVEELADEARPPEEEE